MAKNANLHTAKKEKNDEFYTQLTDIEKELKHYKAHFEGKTVFCNCDDPAESNFWKFFHLKFSDFKLKKLISTHYVTSGETYKMEYNGIEGEDADIGACIRTPLEGNGDFRSPESIAVLQEADIVVTNPPFSLFREYVGQLMKYEKKFLIIGSMNAITYKEIFPLLKTNEIWLGYNAVHEFKQPDGTIKKFGNIGWYTNLDIKKRHEDLVLFRKYADDPSLYPKYDNYDAIEVSKIVDIPCDYDGVMGVPITFLDKYNPDQFEIIWRTGDIDWAKNKCEFFHEPSEELQKKYKNANKTWRVQNQYILDENGTPHTLYGRIFIKRKAVNTDEI